MEGISGAGKTYLTWLLADDLTSHGAAAPLVLDEFSARQQPRGQDLGRDLLQVLVSASGGNLFLRGGHLAAETLSQLAIKMFDYETSTTVGRTVSRSMKSRRAQFTKSCQLSGPGSDCLARPTGIIYQQWLDGATNGRSLASLARFLDREA